MVFFPSKLPLLKTKMVGWTGDGSSIRFRLHGTLLGRVALRDLGVICNRGTGLWGREPQMGTNLPSCGKVGQMKLETMWSWRRTEFRNVFSLTWRNRRHFNQRSLGLAPKSCWVRRTNSEWKLITTSNSPMRTTGLAASIAVENWRRKPSTLFYSIRALGCTKPSSRSEITACEKQQSISWSFWLKLETWGSELRLGLLTGYMTIKRPSLWPARRTQSVAGCKLTVLSSHCCLLSHRFRNHRCRLIRQLVGDRRPEMKPFATSRPPCFTHFRHCQLLRGQVTVLFPQYSSHFSNVHEVRNRPLLLHL